MDGEARKGISVLGKGLLAVVAALIVNIITSLVAPELAVRFLIPGLALLALVTMLQHGKLGDRRPRWQKWVMAALVPTVAVSAWLVWPVGKSIADYVVPPEQAAPALKRWEARPLAAITAHPGEPVPGLALAQGVAFNADSTMLATGGYDTAVRLWDADTGESLGQLKGHTHRVTSVEFQPGSSTLLASAGYDGTVRFWDVNARTQKAVIQTGHQQVAKMVFSANGRYLATIGEYDGSIRIFDVPAAVQIRTLSTADAWVVSVAVSQDGSMIAAGLAANASSEPLTHLARLWDNDTGKQVADLHGHRNWVAGIAFSQDGTTVVTVSHDLTIRRWDPRTGAQSGEPVTDIVTGGDCLELGPSAGIFAICEGQAMSLRDLATSRRLVTIAAMTAPVVDVALSPSGKRMAAATVNGTVGLWEIG